MEGISHEVCSLAGVWGLNKLIALYDDNGISIDGPVDGWFRDDTPARFRAYGWNVIGPVDGHDVLAVGQAIALAKASADKPTLIVCRTTIGQGSPGRAGTAKAHGEPLGAEEIAKTRAAIDWTAGAFEVPDDPARAVGRARTGQGARSRVDGAAGRVPRRASGAGGRIRASHARRPAGRLRNQPALGDRGLRPEPAGRGLAQGVAEGARRAGAEGARDVRRQRRPDRLQPDRLPRLRRASPQLRRARIRHGCGHERRGAARRLHPLWRHLPDLQRLQPQRQCAWRR